ERIDDFSEEARRKLISIDEEITAGQGKIRQCREKEETLRGILKETSISLKDSEEALSRSEAERGNFQNEIKTEEKKSMALRQEIEDLKEKINRAKLLQSEIVFKMNNLVELVKEKFNLALLEIYQQYLEDEFSVQEIREKLEHQKVLKERLGEVNLTAIQEHEALKERFQFISGQREDLLKSMESLNRAIGKINKISLEKFVTTFGQVDKKLKEVFPILFNGGSAGLKMTDEENPLESGVLVEVKPPGKKLSHMGLLSGGEKALVAMALLFAIYLIKPSPFCLLDEVDAPLDEANIDRFNNLLDEIKKYSQIILVTHNRKSMEIVDSLYGVTMEKAGVSKIVSVDLEGFERN
ncbi:chromosome segregation protein SMC, partial [Thermodesulfobacteriota bacterium]